MSFRHALLGPQRHERIVRDVIDRHGIDGPLATITAGWEERESEDDELDQHLDGRTRNLNLFQRAEDVFHRDPELLAGMQARHDLLRRQQFLYRRRLHRALKAARELLAGRDGALEEIERESAIQAIRDLDAHHLRRVATLTAEFEDQFAYGSRPAVARHREEIQAELEPCAALLVAGGHVAILRNRLRMFGILPMIGERPVIAWSAGAMALSSRIVLFHDRPPQGRGDAEVLEPGLGLFRGVIPLPHARRRLLLDNQKRVQLFARRFGPDLCVALDERTCLEGDGQRWWSVEPTRQLLSSGELAEVPGA